MTDECGFARRCGRGVVVVVAVAWVPAAATTGDWIIESRAGSGRAEMTCVARTDVAWSASGSASR